MAEMKAGYKDTDIGVIPEDWDEALIGDLFDFKNGLNKAKEFFGYGTPIVNYMDVFNFSGLRLNNVQGKVNVTFQEKQNFSVKKGDVFFTRTSETVEDIGVASVMLDDCNETVFSGFVLRGRPKSKLIEEDYCKYCFSSDEVRKQITSKSTYTTRALTNGRLLSSVILPLPKPEGQKQIAAALSDVDGLIESLEKLMAKKRDMKTAAMQQLLTGKKRLPGFEGEWRIKKLNDFAEIKKGQLITKKAAVHGDIPVIAGGLKPSYFHNRPNRKPNVITISASGASAGFVAFHSYAIFASDCSTIEQSDAYNTKFIFFALKLRQSEIYELQTGGAQPHVYPEQIKSLYLLFPAIEEQTAIAAILSDMDAEINALEQRLAKTRSLKTGMMQELLTGRTRFIKTDKKQEAV